MTDHPIALHLKASLGTDVGIVLDDPAAPHTVTIYRPDRLSDDFVAAALGDLAAQEPEALSGVDTVLVTFETPLGLSRRRVALPGTETASAPDAA